MMIEVIRKCNIAATLYINIKALPWRQALKFPIVVYGGIQIESLNGKINIKSDRIRRGMIKIGAQGYDMFGKGKCVVSIDGEVEFYGCCSIGTNSSLIIRRNGHLKIGKMVFLGANNLILCEKAITIGDEFMSSWCCQFIDSNTHEIIDINTKIKSEATKAIYIGKHCWLGNHSTVNKGGRLCDNTIVASYSLINKDYSHMGDFCVFAGIPANLKSKGKAWIR